MDVAWNSLKFIQSLFLQNHHFNYAYRGIQKKAITKYVICQNFGQRYYIKEKRENDESVESPWHQMFAWPSHVLFCDRFIVYSCIVRTRFH